VICPLVVTGPTLDGRLDDWPPLPQVAVGSASDWHPAEARFAEYGGPPDISADLRFCWDNRAFYLAIETRDDNLVRVRSASEIDQGDSIVISVAGEEGAEASGQWVVALLRGGSLVWRAQPAERAGEARMVDRALSAREEEGRGWQVIYELALPWSELAPIRPIPGQGFLLTVSICDDDGGGLKGCIERPVRVVFTAEGRGFALAPSRPAALAPSFSRPDVVRFDRRAVVLGNQPRFLLGGEIDYAHLPKSAWAERLAALKAAGMNMVGVSVPWRYHQPRPGAFELSDLKEFLALCRERELLVQLNLGPYAGDGWEAGGVPGWALVRACPVGLQEAAQAWYRALLPMVKEEQVTAGGAVAAVIVRPLPDVAGRVEADQLQGLLELVRGGGIEVPTLTANAPCARDNSKQSLANMLDTLAFYGGVSLAEMMPQLKALAEEENGPLVVSALPGDYASAEWARRSASAVKVAMALGATDLVISEFAPGMPESVVSPGGSAGDGIVNAAGARTPGYGEMGLMGALARGFGAELARAVAAEGVIKADDPQVRAVARLSEEVGFIYLWDEQGIASHQVRLTFTPPGTTASVSIPEAGAIAIPPGCAKVLVVGARVGRGTLLYSTSEVAALHQVGDRTLLVVYGDLDTPGEVALRWPGPPLVSGEVARQRWEAEKNTLILDYYHTQKDQYLLVDELEIAILCRERACSAAQIAGESGAVTISAGAAVIGGSLDPEKLEVALDCQAGERQVTAVLPRPPAAVTVDGRPVEFSFTTPARVLTFALATEGYEEERQPTVLNRLSRVLLGGPPKLQAAFDRAWFMPDSAARAGGSRLAGSIGRPPEELGLGTGSFVRLRASFDPEGWQRMVISGSRDPALVFINDRLVPALCGSAPKREADLSPDSREVVGLRPGRNQIEMVLEILPRADGFAGIWEAKALPQVRLVRGEGGAEGEPIGDWQLWAGLAGEGAGWREWDLDTSRWHFLRLGPWRRQGREPSKVEGVGWYRVPFGLPRPGAWQIPYYLGLTVHGTAAVYLNGALLAICQGDGAYRLPLPAPLLAQGDDNLLAAAVYGLTPETGLDRVEIGADREQMTRRRTLTVKF
jgi:hypothetical protein